MMKKLKYLVFIMLCVVCSFIFKIAVGSYKLYIFGEYTQQISSVLALIIVVVAIILTIYRVVKRRNDF